MNINVISKCRSQIMGFAIIWIMIFHFYKMVNQDYLLFLTSLGYGGVDIFLLLSGLGLYYSWQKDSNLIHFYKKRVLRLLPAFWIVVLGQDIISESISLVTLSKLSTLGLWLPIPGTYWYISAIIAFYVSFPFYMKYYSKYGERTLLAVSMLGILLMLIYTIINHSDSHRYDICFFLSRIPIFYIGITIGKLSYNSMNIKRDQLLTISIFSIASLGILYVTQKLFTYTFLQNTGLNNYPFIVLAPTLSLLLAHIFLSSPKWVNSIISFLGTISLELYLIHILIIKLFKSLLVDTTTYGCITKLFAFIVCCVFVSWILHNLIKISLSKLKL